MTDKPILFKGAMVRAILDGRKTQTRRKLKPWPGYQSEWLTQENLNRSPSCYLAHVDGLLGVQMAHPLAGTMQPYGRVDEDSPLTWVRLPYQPGDRLWLREAWQAHSWASDCVTVRYRAESRTKGFTDQIEQIKYPDGDKSAFKFVACKGPDYWRPSIHMPRWASRLTLVVTDVRVQRLQDISDADAVAEGVIARPARDTFGQDYTGWRSEWPAEADTPEAAHLRALGTARFAFANLWNATYGPEAWAGNPWITAITFEPHRCNIDQMGDTT